MEMTVAGPSIEVCGIEESLLKTVVGSTYTSPHLS
jgi:hypothetical protein